jgi:tol-pal system protein YbgF
MKKLISLAFASLAFACLASNASAFFGDSAKIQALNDRVTKIEAQLSQQTQAVDQKTTNGLMTLSSTLDQIRSNIATLRGEIEVLNYQIGELQKRQQDLYTDLDSRLRRLEGHSSQAAAPASNPFGAEQQAYSGAMTFLQKGDYAGAAKAFAAFVSSYPASKEAPSAQYWVGNSKFALHDYKGAIEAQRYLIANYPQSDKTPDAMLNMASALTELGQIKDARVTLKSIIAKFPGSPAADKAKQRLNP